MNKQQVDSGAASLLVSAKEASAMCSMSLRTWWRKDSAGQIPSAINIGGSAMKRWRVEELHRWITAGCPQRTDWQNMTDINSGSG